MNGNGDEFHMPRDVVERTVQIMLCSTLEDLTRAVTMLWYETTREHNSEHAAALYSAYRTVWAVAKALEDRQNTNPDDSGPGAKLHPLT